MPRCWAPLVVICCCLCSYLPRLAVANDHHSSHSGHSGHSSSHDAGHGSGHTAGHTQDTSALDARRDAQKAELEHQVESQGATITQLKAQIASEDSTIAGLNTQITAKTQESSVLAQQTQDEDATISSLKGQIASLTQEKASLAEQATTREGTISDLESQLKGKTEELTDQVSTVTELREQVTSKASENANLVEQVSSKDARIASFTGEAAKSQEEVSQKVADIASRDATISDVNKENKRLEVQATSQEGTITDLRSQLSAKNEQASTLILNVASEKASAASFKDQLDKETAAHSALEQKHSSLSSEHRRISASYDQLEKAHHDLESKYEDPTVQHFLHAKAVKVYHDPGVEGAANKTFKFVIPSIMSRYSSGKRLFNETQLVVHNKLSTYWWASDQTEPWLPFLSGFLVYGSVIIPFLCTFCCLTRIVCRLKPCLLFCHLDFLLTNMFAGAFAASTGRDPLAAFAAHDASVYLFFQAMFAMIFCIYLLLLFVAYCSAKRGTRESCYRCLQMFALSPIGAVYYVFIWTPAMVDEMPKFDDMVVALVGEGAGPAHVWIPYALLSILVLILLRLEQLSWRASASGPKGANNDSMSITMRETELASVIGEDPEAGTKKE